MLITVELVKAGILEAVISKSSILSCETFDPVDSKSGSFHLKVTELSPSMEEREVRSMDHWLFQFWLLGSDRFPFGTSLNPFPVLY